jgi:hypothetical protein
MTTEDWSNNLAIAHQHGTRDTRTRCFGKPWHKPETRVQALVQLWHGDGEIPARAIPVACTRPE